MIYSGLAETLQARIIADLKTGTLARHPPQSPYPDGHRTVENLELCIAALQDAVAEAESLSEQWREKAETAITRVEALESNFAGLERALANAEALGEKWRQDAKMATKRADDLVAELFEVTSEHVEMSMRTARQAAGRRNSSAGCAVLGPLS